MAAVLVEVPDALIAAAGSEEAVRKLVLHSIGIELVRSGKLTAEQLAVMFEDSLTDWLRLVESGGSFEFWKDPSQDIYTLDDGTPV